MTGIKRGTLVGLVVLLMASQTAHARNPFPFFSSVMHEIGRNRIVVCATTFVVGAGATLTYLWFKGHWPFTAAPRPGSQNQQPAAQPQGPQSNGQPSAGAPSVQPAPNQGRTPTQNGQQPAGQTQQPSAPATPTAGHQTVGARVMGTVVGLAHGAVAVAQAARGAGSAVANRVPPVVRAAAPYANAAAQRFQSTVATVYHTVVGQAQASPAAQPQPHPASPNSNLSASAIANDFVVIPSAEQPATAASSASPEAPSTPPAVAEDSAASRTQFANNLMRQCMSPTFCQDCGISPSRPEAPASPPAATEHSAPATSPERVVPQAEGVHEAAPQPEAPAQVVAIQAPSAVNPGLLANVDLNSSYHGTADSTASQVVEPLNVQQHQLDVPQPQADVASVVDQHAPQPAVVLVAEHTPEPVRTARIRRLAQEQQQDTHAQPHETVPAVDQQQVPAAAANETQPQPQ